MFLGSGLGGRSPRLLGSCRCLGLHLHGGDEEAAEGAEPTLIEDALLGPEGDPEPVPHLQDQRHAIGAAAIGAPGV